MTDTPTINPDQLPMVTDFPADLRALVFSPGGPLKAIPHERLLAKLVATNLVKTTREVLYGDLAHDEDSVALVINDPTPALNGWYRKIGASAVGNWDQFEELSKAVRIAAEEARDRAETAADHAAASASRFAPFLSPGQLTADLQRVFNVDLYESVGGVELAWPDDIKVEEVGRQAGTERARYRIAGRNGADPFSLLARESKGGAAFVGVAGLEGVLDFPIFAHDTSLGVPAGTEVGRFAWDVTGPTALYATAYDYETSGLNRARLLMSVAHRQRVAELIEGALADEAKREGPFAASVRDKRLRDDVEGVGGIFTQADHRYGLSSIELSHFPNNTPPTWRARATVRDWTSGVDVAQGGRIFTEDPTGTGQHLFLHKGTLPGFTGQQFAIELKPGAQWIDNGVTRTFASYTVAGFRADRMATSEKVEDFLEAGPPVADQDIIIKASGGDATSLAAAHAPFYDANYSTAPEAQKFSAFPNSNLAHYWNKVRFLLADPQHDEEAARVVSLWHSIIQGRGMFNTRLYNTDPTKRVLETTWPQWKVDLAIEQFANQYGEHIDDANGQSKLATVGDAVQNAFLDQGWLRVWHRAHGADASNGSPSCVGMGGSSGQRQRIISSLFEQVSGSPIAAMFIHNTPNSVRGGSLSIEQGSILRNTAGTPALQLLGSFGQSTFTEIYVSADSRVESGIQGNVLIADGDANMPAIARARWPYRVRGHLPDGITISDPKMRVLTVDAGTTISTASGVAKALFGTRYDPATGKGEALTLDGSVQALATKLNGLQGATMSLARDGVAAEAITIGDYTGMSEGAILAALNDQLSSFNIAPARIDGEVGVEP
ncbi:hypothetical protein AAG607_13700 [Citromicrobium bathyomarinum]|uniref:hypothetical protein n=1 Tax=Citromicrobium bathyomarinum TaxID=72174 RepID=UPI00315AAE27